VGGFVFECAISVTGLEFLLVGLTLGALAPGLEALFFAVDFFLEEEVSAVGESSFFRFRPRGETGGDVGFLMGKDERGVAATDDDGTGADGETGDGGSA
jgi:hypothetical protein